MDTRSKILTVAAARRLPPPLAVATGHFDILRAGEIRELEQARVEGAALVAVVLPKPGAWLSQEARAGMAAALRVIDYVVAAEETDPEPLFEALHPVRVSRLEEAEVLRARQLIEHVHRLRHS